MNNDKIKIILSRLKKQHREIGTAIAELDKEVNGALQNEKLKELVEFEGKIRGQSLENLLTKSRVEPLVYVRQDVIWLALSAGFSKTLIAEFFGMDVSSIQYVYQKYNRTLKRKCHYKFLSASVDTSNQVKTPSILSSAPTSLLST